MTFAFRQKQTSLYSLEFFNKFHSLSLEMLYMYIFTKGSFCWKSLFNLWHAKLFQFLQFQQYSHIVILNCTTLLDEVDELVVGEEGAP